MRIDSYKYNWPHNLRIDSYKYNWPYNLRIGSYKYNWPHNLWKKVLMYMSYTGHRKIMKLNHVLNNTWVLFFTQNIYLDEKT